MSFSVQTRCSCGIDVYRPGLSNSVATDNAVQTTKSFSALSAKREASHPVPPFHEETVAATLLPALGESPESTRALGSVR